MAAGDKSREKLVDVAGCLRAIETDLTDSQNDGPVAAAKAMRTVKETLEAIRSHLQDLEAAQEKVREAGYSPRRYRLNDLGVPVIDWN